MLGASPATTRTGAPGRSRRCGATQRQPSEALSATAASHHAGTRCGAGTSIASANGTRRSPESPPMLRRGGARVDAIGGWLVGAKSEYEKHTARVAALCERLDPSLDEALAGLHALGTGGSMAGRPPI